MQLSALNGNLLDLMNTSARLSASVPGALRGFVGGDAQLDGNLPTGTTGSLEDYLSV